MQLVIVMAKSYAVMLQKPKDKIIILKHSNG